MHKSQQNDPKVSIHRRVCKTFIRRFDPAPRLQHKSPRNPIKTGIFDLLPVMLPSGMVVPGWWAKRVFSGANGRSNRDQSGIKTGIKNTTPAAGVR